MKYTGKPELLCPAGSLEKLKTAFRYGADAVYIGGNFFGLRARADNFTPEEMKEGIELAHSLGKKVYVTMNILARNQDLEGMLSYAKELRDMKADGVIVSDLGSVAMIRQEVPELLVHVSTQANNLNWRTCQAWLSMGCDRVNLARELSLEEIRELSDQLAARGADFENEIKLEAFVHGAMCMSFSGRCMLSDYMAGRSSNRGDCSQPCRWNYHLVEERRPGEYLPVFENERGTFIFNSKDLCMLEYIPELIEAGVGSLKIEGRMKSEYYVGVTVAAYRRAIDAYMADPEGYKKNRPLIEELLKEVCMVSHRDYTTGFYLDKKGEQVYSTSSYLKDSDYIGVTKGCEEIGEGKYRLLISQRGAFNLGETLDFLIPGEAPKSQVIGKMTDAKGEEIERAPHPMMDVYVETDFYVPDECLVRRLV